MSRKRYGKQARKGNNLCEHHRPIKFITLKGRKIPMACDCEKKGLIIKGQLELNLSPCPFSIS